MEFYIDLCKTKIDLDGEYLIVYDIYGNEIIRQILPDPAFEEFVETKTQEQAIEYFKQAILHTEYVRRDEEHYLHPAMYPDYPKFVNVQKYCELHKQEIIFLISKAENYRNYLMEE